MRSVANWLPRQSEPGRGPLNARELRLRHSHPTESVLPLGSRGLKGSGFGVTYATGSAAFNIKCPDTWENSVIICTI